MTDWSIIPDGHEADSPITEKFDPHWPYNFKWGWNHETNQTNVWRVQGGTDGRPTHRAELAQLWGRLPQAREGDVLGLASYIPPERKLDDTVVAPAVVLVQAYYGQDVPGGVFEWFEQAYPGTVVRRSRLASIKTAEADWSVLDQADEDVFKWVWSKKDGILIWLTDDDGLPTHTEKIKANWGHEKTEQDWLGYAVPLGDQIEMETYRAGIPRLGLSQVKVELSKLNPGKEVLLPDEYLTTDVFNGDPAKIARRMNAAEWAQATLEVVSYTPSEASVSHAAPTAWKDEGETPSNVIAGLKRLFRSSTVKKSEADMSGAMIAVFLRPEDAEKLSIKGGEPEEQMHITLCYFSDKAADRDDWDECVKIVEQIAAQHPRLTGKVNGYGVFSNDVDVLWAAPSVPGLAELRHKIFEACEDAGFHVDTKFDWAPHITLKYDHKGKLPKAEGVEIEFPTLTFAQGDDHEDFDFSGHFEKTADDDWSLPGGEWGAQSWSGWQGAHRFVTDGKEVLTEPESQTGGHGAGHSGLTDRFRDFYPESEDLVGGWAVPTADDMGYGVHVYHDQVPLQDVMSALDKHLDKPTHFVNWDDLFDPTRYKSFTEGGQRNVPVW